MSFSIVIASYNQQDYLPDAIESALAQSEKAEVIVVDDGSTDYSLTIARSYAGVKVISQVNKGLASARNTGIMNATGDYILFLDADDILLESCIEKISFAAKQNNSDVIAPSFKSFGVQNGEVILQGIPTMDDFKKGNRLGYFSAIKRSVLLEIGGYQPKMTYGFEDWHLWFDIFSRGKTLCILKEVLVLYRTKTESMITNANKHAGELMDQIAKDFPTIWPR